METYVPPGILPAQFPAVRVIEADLRLRAKSSASQGSDGQSEVVEFIGSRLEASCTEDDVAQRRSARAQVKPLRRAMPNCWLSSYGAGLPVANPGRPYRPR